MLLGSPFVQVVQFFIKLKYLIWCIAGSNWCFWPYLRGFLFVRPHYSLHHLKRRFGSWAVASDSETVTKYFALALVLIIVSCVLSAT